MGCCISRSEPDTEPVSSHLTHDVGSPTVPPPQYNEQQGFVVDTGKAQIDSGSKSRPDDGEKQPSQAPAFTLGAVSTTTATTTTTMATTMTTMEEEEDSTVWPIFIRPSISGKDISVDLPRTAPFWTLQQLRQHIEPQLQTTHTPLRIRFIYLGKILPESTTLIPNASTSSSTSGSLLLDKQAVIQAMVSTNVESP
ncbi:hypothetical protein [Absidia glauca]|uniref:DSC E3 ubiquitin ligase complex subunit 3 ubiquitin-like domain-containing protein n=1 Tax=Absidia glauca TaxID=4829 RepID=A0A163K8C5_ABSGL|nr:hypothetical protein [Absidia glauca]